jgi:hypothetical protein
MKKYSVPALIFNAVSVACFIASIWAPKSLDLRFLIGGTFFYTISLSFRLLELEDRQSRLKNAKEEKTTVIVSPEDFERFKKGEMTKEEMLNIKKAVDKVTEMKQEA